MVSTFYQTTAAAVDLIYCLAKNPEKQERLREELNKVPLDEYGCLTPSSFKSVPYFRACFKESLRFIPVAAGNSRAAGQDLDIKGYFVPKGVNFQHSNSHWKSVLIFDFFFK